MTNIITEFTGLDAAADYFQLMPERTAKAARLAINTVINRSGMRLIQDEMYADVNFPKNYLKGDRLAVTELATENKLVGAIKARKRATSLARFAAPGTPLGSRAGAQVRVMVNAGQGVTLRNAWLVRLRKGASLTEDNYNIGLAVRLHPGEKLNKKTAHHSWLVPDQVALLYGPSVDQVFKDVAEETGPRILDLTSAEFFRQFERLQ